MTYIAEVPSSSAVSNAAVDVRNALSELSGVVTEAQNTWANLRASYETPEQETVFAALDSLPGIADALVALLDSAATALDTYATDLQTLESQRGQVVSDMQEMEAEQPGSSWSMVQAFNGRVREADAECARALRALQLDGMPEVGSYLLDPYTAGSAGIGLAGSALEWHRGALLRFRDSANIPAAILKPTVPFDSWTHETFQGRTYGVDPRSGLLLPQSAAPAPETPRVSSSQLRAVPVAPTWAKYGGRGLGVLGAGVTLYGAWGTEYNESLVRNPQYSESQHQTEATQRAAVTGGFEVAGALGGAAVGASWGATLGSAVPVVGTIAGGILGGLVGGLVGGFAGKKTGESVEELVFD